MKFGKIYSDAISLTPQDREKLNLPELEAKPTNNVSPAEDAASAQERINWLQSPVTSALLKDLGSQVEESINEAMKLATSFSSHQNPWRIIQLLNKASELRNLIHHYGRNTNTR